MTITLLKVRIQGRHHVYTDAPHYKGNKTSCVHCPYTCALRSLKISAFYARDNDLRWWSTQFYLHCSFTYCSPSCDNIRGFLCMTGKQSAKRQRLWTTDLEEARSHNNLLELKLAYLTLQCFLKKSGNTCFEEAGQ